MTELILEWAEQRGILTKGTPDRQFIKLIEEVGELANGISKNDRAEIADAIGDCVVVLTILAEMYNMNIDDCVKSAYVVISKRKGSMVDGVFVKEN
jgi:NTP pyrophosphatase (non-canonical NTP hydrolase)